MRNGDSLIDARRPFGITTSRLAVLVVLFAFGAILESVRLSALANPAIWGHLKVGGWILDNREWPHTGIFSRSANLRWRDFSWGYDVLAAAVYRMLGLRAVPGLLMAFRVVLAVTAFLVAGGRRGNFWIAVVLSALAQIPLFSIGPVAENASVILFGLELLLLLESRRSGNFGPLCPLPVLFFVWANLDIGFVYGMGLFALFVVVLVVEQMGRTSNWGWLGRHAEQIPLARAALVGAGCALASMVNPYGHQGYATFWSIQTAAVNRELPDFAAMKFHQPQDYLVLLLAMAAFLSLGLRRSRDLFLLSLLIVSGALSFHTQRENWLIICSAVAVIGAMGLRRQGEAKEERDARWGRPVLAVAGLTLIVVLLAFVLRVPCDRNSLLSKAAAVFPVRACDAIRMQKLAPPLFNSYAWGAFLTWYLPEYPVAIDGRRGLYPEEEETNYFKVMNAEMPYQSFAPMSQARTLLLDRDGPMGEALRSLAGFHVAYEDGISIVLLQDQKE